MSEHLWAGVAEYVCGSQICSCHFPQGFWTGAPQGGGNNSEIREQWGTDYCFLELTFIQHHSKNTLKVSYLRLHWSFKHCYLHMNHKHNHSLCTICFISFKHDNLHLTQTQSFFMYNPPFFSIIWASKLTLKTHTIFMYNPFQYHFQAPQLHSKCEHNHYVQKVKTLIRCVLHAYSAMYTTHHSGCLSHHSKLVVKNMRMR